MVWWTGRQGGMMRIVARLRPLTFLVLVFVATSFVLTLTIGNPRADELYFLGLHIQTLLAAETLSAARQDNLKARERAGAIRPFYGSYIQTIRSSQSK